MTSPGYFARLVRRAAGVTETHAPVRNRWPGAPDAAGDWELRDAFAPPTFSARLPERRDVEATAARNDGAAPAPAALHTGAAPDARAAQPERARTIAAAPAPFPAAGKLIAPQSVPQPHGQRPRAGPSPSAPARDDRATNARPPQRPDARDDAGVARSGDAVPRSAHDARARTPHTGPQVAPELPRRIIARDVRIAPPPATSGRRPAPETPSAEAAEREVRALSGADASAPPRAGYDGVTRAWAVRRGPGPAPNASRGESAPAVVTIDEVRVEIVEPRPALVAAPAPRSAPRSGREEVTPARPSRLAFGLAQL